jgi:autotransporter strand-loop-strand O-heptosyltransferase
MRRILVFLESFSIGDTVAAIPYVDKFQEVNSEDEITISINDWLIPYFSTIYTNLKFIGKNTDYIFDKVIDLKYDYSKSIQQVYAEQLGFINAPYIRPKILIPELQRPIKNKYVTIGIHSTSQLKYWNHPLGKKSQPESLYWDELCGILRKKGYTPVVVEQHEMFGWAPYRNGLPQKANKKFGQSLSESMNYIYHSEFYIGLSSGMSWVAHAMGKPVAMISNFTEDWNEFDLSTPDYIRITNKDVCHGCWNLVKKEFEFDGDDWYWCPKHKGTDRQFECHTSITPEMVLNEIKEWLPTINK